MFSKCFALVLMGASLLTAISFVICGIVTQVVTDCMFGIHMAVFVAIWMAANILNAISVIKNDSVDSWWDGATLCAVLGYVFAYLATCTVTRRYHFYLFELDFGTLALFVLGILTFIYGIFLGKLKDTLHPAKS